MSYATVDATRARAPVSLDPPSVPAAAAPGVSSNALLPQPIARASVDISDALSQLMAMDTKLNDAEGKGAQANAQSIAARRKAATDDMLKKLNDAADEARKAKESSGGLFGFISKNLGGAGLVGLLTGNLPLVVADFTAHVSKLEDNKVDLTDAAGIAATFAGPAGAAVYMGEEALKKYGPDDLSKAMSAGPSISDDKVAIANQMLLTIYEAQYALAATVMSGGTSAPALVAMAGVAISTTTNLMNESGAMKAIFKSDAGTIGMVGGMTGAALSLGAAGYTGVTSIMDGAANFDDIEDIANLADKAKTVTEGAYDVGEGVNNWIAAGHQHDADYLRVDAKQQQQLGEFLDRLMTSLVDDMKAKEKSHERTTKVLASASETNNQTQLIASNLKV